MLRPGNPKVCNVHPKQHNSCPSPERRPTAGPAHPDLLARGPHRSADKPGPVRALHWTVPGARVEGPWPPAGQVRFFCCFGSTAERGRFSPCGATTTGQRFSPPGARAAQGGTRAARAGPTLGDLAGTGPGAVAAGGADRGHSQAIYKTSDGSGKMAAKIQERVRYTRPTSPGPAFFLSVPGRWPRSLGCGWHASTSWFGPRKRASTSRQYPRFWGQGFMEHPTLLPLPRLDTSSPPRIRGIGDSSPVPHPTQGPSTAVRRRRSHGPVVPGRGHNTAQTLLGRKEPSLILHRILAVTPGRRGNRIRTEFFR